MMKKMQGTPFYQTVMSHYAASNDVWDGARSWSTNNRTLRVPTLADIEPCAALRIELMHARRQIASLEARAGGQAAPQPPAQPPANGVDGELVIGDKTFEDGLTTDARMAALRTALGAINDKTVVVEAPSGIQLNCGGVQRPANNATITRQDGKPSVGGVFILVGDSGMKAGFDLIDLADAPKRTVYGTGALNEQKKVGLADLRDKVLAHAALQGVQVFVSDGTLVVPCANYSGKAILYGRNGIAFRGNTVAQDQIQTL